MGGQLCTGTTWGSESFVPLAAVRFFNGTSDNATAKRTSIDGPSFELVSLPIAATGSSEGANASRKSWAFHNHDNGTGKR